MPTAMPSRTSTGRTCTRPRSTATWDTCARRSIPARSRACGATAIPSRPGRAPRKSFLPAVAARGHLLPRGGHGKTPSMHALKRTQPGEGTPALARLLSESALYRAALGACGFPVAILDAADPARPVGYVNAAFEEFFDYEEAQVLGRSLAQLVLRGDEPLAHRLLAGSRAHWQINVFTREGTAK